MKSQSKFPLRLAVWVILNGDPRGFFCLIAVVCSSFSAINIATSRRSPCTPFGDISKQYVRESQLLVGTLGPYDSVPSKVFILDHCGLDFWGRKLARIPINLDQLLGCLLGRRLHDWTAGLQPSLLVSQIWRVTSKTTHLAGWMVVSPLWRLVSDPYLQPFFSLDECDSWWKKSFKQCRILSINHSIHAFYMSPGKGTVDGPILLVSII